MKKKHIEKIGFVSDKNTKYLDHIFLYKINELTDAVNALMEGDDQPTVKGEECKHGQGCKITPYGKLYCEICGKTLYDGAHSTQEEWEKEFDKRWKHSVYEENYAEDGDCTCGIDDMKDFIKKLLSTEREKMLEVVAESFEKHMHYGIHGKPVENSLMHVKDLKRFVLEDLEEALSTDK